MPCKQYKLIGKDKLSIAAYVARTLDGVAQNSHLRSDNYFYFNCLTGRCVPLLFDVAQHSQAGIATVQSSLLSLMHGFSSQQIHQVCHRGRVQLQSRCHQAVASHS